MDKIKRKYKYPLGRIRFINEWEFNNRINNYYSEHDGIPEDKIIHGSLSLAKDYQASIVDYYNEYYIVNYETKINNTQLGFRESQLQAYIEEQKEEIKFTVKIIEE